MEKSEIGKVVSFKFANMKSKIQGVVLNYNMEWILVKRITDLSVDGFTVFRNQMVEYEQTEYDRFTMKILKVKNYSHLNEPEVAIDTLENILRYADDKFKLIQLDSNDGEESDVVKYNGLKNKVHLFDAMDTMAKWIYKLKLPEEEIRYIGFDNSYVNSLKLLTKFKTNKVGKATKN